MAGLRLCSPNLPYNTKEAVSAVCSPWSENPGLVWNGRSLKRGGGGQGGCFLSFIRFAVDMGNVCCDLPPQSEAVCHHIDSGNQKEKRPADYPLTGFQKIGCLQREARQFKKMLNGLSNRTECARATPTTPKKSQHSSLPSVLAQRWDEKSTYREKWPVKLQSGRFAPSVQAQRFPL